MSDTKEKDILRGGQFLVKETKCEDVFTLEDLNEEQKMMRESTKEFVDRELWAHWERFEKKDYAYTEECMNKAGELGLLSIAVPKPMEVWEWDLFPLCWSVTIFQAQQGPSVQHLVRILELEPCPLPYMEPKSKNKNMYLNWLPVNGLARIA